MNEPITPSEDDLRELFGLFTSTTPEEMNQIYSPMHHLFFKNENLDEEYTLIQEKREFAMDSWPSVLCFLERHGFTITRV